MNHPARPIASLAAFAVTGLVLVGCSTREQAPVSPAVGDATRYCSLVGEVNDIGERVFGDVPEHPPAAEVGRRQGLLLDQAAAHLAEMQEVAPAQIRGDVTVFLTDLRARTTA